MGVAKWKEYLRHERRSESLEEERNGAESAREETSDPATKGQETEEERTDGEEESDEDKGKHETRQIVIFLATALIKSTLLRISRTPECISDLRNWEGIPSSGPAKLRLGSNG